jgi:lipoprotein-anchoring transpeptidase ErfK/SrfK
VEVCVVAPASIIGLALASACVSSPPPRATHAAPAIAAHARHEAEDRAVDPAPGAPSSELASATEILAPAPAPTITDATDAPTEVDDGPRITSVAMTTWIYKRPEAKESGYLGYVRTGRSVHVKSLTTVGGIGCPGGFFEALPRGYICNDHTVAREASPLYAAVDRATRPHGGPLPYRYALSDGAPMYNRVPTADEIRKTELYLGKPHEFSRLYPTLRAHEELAIADPIEANGPVPAFLEDGGGTREPPFDLVARTIPRGSMLSFERSFDVDGRVYLLSSDHTIVPADRVRLFRPSTFHGTALGADGASLPIAWMRATPKKKYALAKGASVEGGHVTEASTVPEASMLETGDEWPARSFVELGPGVLTAGKRRFLETKERADGAPLYVLEADATVVDREAKLPPGVRAGQKWIFVSITKGTLVAYEDLEPVYATLVSPGAGGVPIEGHDHVKEATTPIGTFTITFKDRAATMSPDKGDDRTFWIADVPYTQYFDAPFALHGAFWHERFGELVSAGCVNLSPIDAELLFGWTDPPVPDEWQGATAAGAPENGKSTVVVIRR